MAQIKVVKVDDWHFSTPSLVQVWCPVLHYYFLPEAADCTMAADWEGCLPRPDSLHDVWLLMMCGL